MHGGKGDFSRMNGDGKQALHGGKFVCGFASLVCVFLRVSFVLVAVARATKQLTSVFGNRFFVAGVKRAAVFAGGVFKVIEGGGGLAYCVIASKRSGVFVLVYHFYESPQLSRRGCG